MPGKHGTQLELVVEPTSVLYVPAGHLTHTACPASALKEPAGQVLHWGWPAALAVPGPHDRQLALPLDPSLGLYVPAGHGVQLLPGCAEYVPG